MGSVSSSSAFHGLVDSGVSDDEVVDVQSLRFGVGNGVSEKRKDMSHGLFGPSSLSQSPLFGLTGSSSAAFVLGEGNASGVVEDFIQVLFGLLDEHASDGFGSFVGVFEVDSEVEALGAAG